MRRRRVAHVGRPYPYGFLDFSKNDKARDTWTDCPADARRLYLSSWGAAFTGRHGAVA